VFAPDVNANIEFNWYDQMNHGFSVASCLLPWKEVDFFT